MKNFIIRNRKILSLIFGFAMLADLSFSLYKFFKPDDSVVKPQNTASSTLEKSSIASSSRLSEETKDNQMVNLEDVIYNPGLYIPDLKDSDNDGLADNDEKIYGTDPKKFDTDNDGLSDSLEVMAYFTEPKNPDTDGDGFKDGDEVKKGFNPHGEGKLIYPIKQPKK